MRLTVSLPSSKSISNRALIIHALSRADSSLLHGVSDCDDTFVMQRALALLASERQDTACTTPPSGEAAPTATIDIMAAGTSMRFLTALLAVSPGCHVITGSERMRHRPVKVLVDALRQLGADISYEEAEGFPPLRINGRILTGGRIDIQGDVSSQYISALLMIGPLMTNGLELHLTGRIISRPYIRMTVEMMRLYGAEVKWHGNRTLQITPRPYAPVPYQIEGDWSAASYWFEIMALLPSGNSLTLSPLSPHSLQGDATGREVFAQLGVLSRFANTGATGHSLPLSRQVFHAATPLQPSPTGPSLPLSRQVFYAATPLQPSPTGPSLHLSRRAPTCQRLDHDFSRIPDLAQTVVVTCCLLGIPFRFTGLQTLRIKETDRITALDTELRKLGVRLEVQGDDTLAWEGPERQTGGRAAYLTPADDVVIDTYDDHRMAMAFAPAALRLGHITINHPEVVSKSYPRYWDDLRRAGFLIEEL